MTAYYNEIDEYCVAWLKNLIAAGLIPAGEVDDRDIRDVTPADLAGFSQCHFFAGLGGWAYAGQLAGWSDDRPLWTGSCPCQPFSAAGRRAGFADERHLWPAWYWLIAQCRPPVIFGEQVASKDGLGWFDLVHADLEAAGYAVGAVDFCAAGVGAPHIRQRLWFVGDAIGAGLEGLSRHGDGAAGWAQPDRSIAPADAPGSWRDADWLPCRDGKHRPVEPGAFPLAHGIPARTSKLRAIGNAIVPQVAAEIMKAYVG